MRRAADDDVAAFHQFDARLAGLDADIAPAAEDCFRVAVLEFHLHRAGNENIFAINRADGVEGRLIGARADRDSERGTREKGNGGERNFTAREMSLLEQRRASALLPRALMRKQPPLLISRPS